jgi:hypothetical protein
MWGSRLSDTMDHSDARPGSSLAAKPPTQESLGAGRHELICSYCFQMLNGSQCGRATSALRKYRRATPQPISLTRCFARSSSTVVVADISDA